MSIDSDISENNWSKLTIVKWFLNTMMFFINEN